MWPSRTIIKRNTSRWVDGYVGEWMCVCVCDLSFDLVGYT